MEAGARARPAYRRHSALAAWAYSAREVLGPWVALTKPRILPMVIQACENFTRLGRDEIEEMIKSAEQYEPLFA